MMGRSASGSGAQVGLLLQVLLHQRADVFAVERPLPGEQLLVNDGQAVLIAALADLALEGFRERVQRRDAAEQAGAVWRSRCLTRPKSATLTRSLIKKQVARLDVEVLKLVLLVHVIEGFGGVAQVAQQVVAGDADQPGVMLLDEQIVQAAVGQLHDDDQLAFDFLDLLESADERMANLLDALQGVHFLLGADAFPVEGIEVAVDKLDGLEQAAWSFALPDLAEAAAAQRFDQAIAWNRLGVSLPQPTHFVVPLRSWFLYKRRSNFGRCPIRSRFSRQWTLLCYRR